MTTLNEGAGKPTRPPLRWTTVHLPWAKGGIQAAYGEVAARANKPTHYILRFSNGSGNVWPPLEETSEQVANRVYKPLHPSARKEMSRVHSIKRSTREGRHRRSLIRSPAAHPTNKGYPALPHFIKMRRR